MARYVLVHGAFQGSFVWDGIRAGLEKAGHSVETPDLPSMGDDKTPVESVTFDSYVNRVVETLDARAEPAILVGHSLAGFVISQAAENRPEKVKRLVYIAAFLLPNGSCPKKFYEEMNVPSPVMKSSDVTPEGIVHFRPEELKKQHFNLSPEEDEARVRARLRPMSRKPLGTPLALTRDRFGAIPRRYLLALHDNAIPTRFQEIMVNELRCEKVIRMNADHSPMFSAPEETLAALLDAAA